MTMKKIKPYGESRGSMSTSDFLTAVANVFVMNFAAAACHLESFAFLISLQQGQQFAVQKGTNGRVGDAMDVTCKLVHWFIVGQECSGEIIEDGS